MSELEEWQVLNRLLTLYVCKTARKTTYVKDTRMQKAVFMSQLKMYTDHCYGFNYNFIRYHYGPYSPELKQELDTLVDMEYLRSGNYGYHLTKQAYKLLNDFSSVFSRNRHQINHIKVITKGIMENTLESMLSEVYAQENPIDKGVTIEDTPLESPLLLRSMDNPKRQFRLTEDEWEDISMLLDPEFSSSMKRSREALDRGEYSIWVPTKN